MGDLYDFNSLLARRNTDCTKWDALMRDYGRDDLMPFWVADMDFPVLPEISEAIRNRAAPGQTFGYTFTGHSYLQSVIGWNLRRHDLRLTEEEILPVPGVVTAMAIILMALTQKGDRVVINPPVYPPFYQVVGRLGRELVPVPLVKKQRYELDFEALEREFRKGVQAYLFCSPHNPVGRVWTEQELMMLTALCRKYHVLMVSDEIHSDIVYTGSSHTTILKCMEEAIALTAPSKTFNLAGLKSSTMLIRDPALRQQVGGMMETLHLYCNLFSYCAAEAAYTSGDRWVDELNQYLKENAETVCGFLKDRLPTVAAYVPEGTYLMWLDFSKTGLAGEALQKQLVEKAGLALNAGSSFGQSYGGFARMNIAAPRSYLIKGLEKMAAAF